MTMVVICLSVGMHVGCLTMRVLLLLLGDDFLFLDLMSLDMVIEFELAHLYIANGTLSLPRVLHLHVLLDENFDDFISAYFA